MVCRPEAEKIICCVFLGVLCDLARDTGSLTFFAPFAALREAEVALAAIAVSREYKKPASSGSQGAGFLQPCGNPAVSERPVAFRPHLTMGLAFSSSYNFISYSARQLIRQSNVPHTHSARYARVRRRLE